MNLSKVIKLNICVVLLHSSVFKLRTAKFEKEISGYYIVFSFLCILWWWSHIRTQDNDINALALELHTTMDEESVKVACNNHVNNPVFVLTWISQINLQTLHKFLLSSMGILFCFHMYFPCYFLISFLFIFFTESHK